MKTMMILLISTGLLGGFLPSLYAQGPASSPDAPAFGLRKKSGGKQDIRRSPRGDRMKMTGNKKYIEAWLERLKNKDPEEYERLNRLRENKPEAFRTALRARLREERTRQSFKDFPQIAEALKNMSPEDRQRFLNRFGSRQGGGRLEERPDIPRELHQQIRKLAEAYALTDNADLHADIRAQLKARLGQMHQARQQARIDHLQKIEKQLEKLRSSIEEDQGNREAFIEQQLNRILKPTSLASRRYSPYLSIGYSSFSRGISFLRCEPPSGGILH